MFVIEQEAMPIGWIQWYLWSDYPQHARQLGAEPASAGIDLAIGELSMTGVGLGPTAIREFVRQVVFSNPEVRAVVCDPEESNLRSLRAFEKAGFKMVRTVQLTGERCRRQVVRLDRADIADPREYELRAVQTEEDWTAYHRIRRTVLFEARGRFGIYDQNNPDDRAEGNHPLLLVFRGDVVGVVRLDCGSSDVGIIRQLAIDGPAQGVGHGGTLLQILVARGMALGLRVLEVNSDRQAVGFYQRFGFDLVDGEREHPLLRLSIPFFATPSPRQL
jgi:GNAT superfamily N-acetyltransferase